MTALTTASADELRRRLTGDLHLPGDAGYDEATVGWNVLYQHRPAAVGVPAHTADVVELVRYARASGLKIGILATGHGPGLTVDGDLLIRTQRLDSVTVDPVASTALIGGGVKWGPVLAAAQQHGLAPLLGSTTDVGAVGYTLGGGFGWLGRKYGMAADSVISFEVVTTDGMVLRVSADENPELFWALRGGGAGSVAIVTAMEVALYPVDTVYAGNLFYPAEMAVDVMRRWRDWITDVPEDLTSSVVVMNFPPFEDVPEPLRGQSFVIVRGCFDGATEAGEQLLSYWRDWQTPVIDMWAEMPFTQADTISNDPVDPLPALLRGGWLRELGDDAIEVFVSNTLPTDGSPLLLFSEIRHTSGVIARNDSSAYGNRDEKLLFSAVGLGMTPEMTDALKAHMGRMDADLAPYRAEGAYLNFLDAEDRRAATRRGVSDFDRLAAVKAVYDPTDVMSHGLDLTT